MNTETRRKLSLSTSPSVKRGRTTKIVISLRIKKLRKLNFLKKLTSITSFGEIAVSKTRQRRLFQADHSRTIRNKKPKNDYASLFFKFTNRMINN